MSAAVLRMLLAMVLLFGTLAPSISAGKGLGEDDCGADCASSTSSHAGSPCGDEEPHGDCQQCAPNCLCSCCALRCGVAFSVVFSPAILSANDTSAPLPADLCPVLSVADIFHPPRA